MNIAIVGCGFVADFYAITLRNYPHLTLQGVYDVDNSRQQRFAKHYGLNQFLSLQQILDSESVDIVLNLTNPGSHFVISKACLESGKHVYSEKPLSTDLAQAEELVALAASKNLSLSGAPCSILSESAQTLWKQVRENNVGRIRLVYAELDDGLVHRMRYKKWLSESGTPWPYVDEFEVGCTMEHAGYYVTWLVAIFGSVKKVTSFAACVIPDKETDPPLNSSGNDFSVACLEFESGMVARLTCSIVAPHDHSITIFGDEGILSIDECWNYKSPVLLKRLTKVALWAEKYSEAYSVTGAGAEKMSFAGTTKGEA